MPYSRESYFDPPQSYKEKWSLAPQGSVLHIDGLKTKTMFAELSSAIPLYYILMFLAIGFDIYLGFAILSKSGVNIALISVGVIADFFLAILPFLLAVKIDARNYIKTENKIFQTLLEIKTRLIDEKDNESKYKERVRDKEIALKKFRSNQRTTKILKYLFIAIILAIAAFKIYTFYSVLPPGFSLFSVANGKIVILFSVLCAIFHIIGSEKAFAHLMFWSNKNATYEKQMELKEAGNEHIEVMEIPYLGNYKPAKYKNTEVVVDEEGNAKINYINIIWDDEIKQLAQRQGDQNARQGLTIVCKQQQL